MDTQFPALPLSEENNNAKDRSCTAVPRIVVASLVSWGVSLRNRVREADAT